MDPQRVPRHCGGRRWTAASAQPRDQIPGDPAQGCEVDGSQGQVSRAAFNMHVISPSQRERSGGWPCLTLSINGQEGVANVLVSVHIPRSR